MSKNLFTINFSFLCINQKGSDVIYSFSNETVVKSTTNSVSIVTGWYKKGHLYAVVNIVTLKKKKCEQTQASRS